MATKAGRPALGHISDFMEAWFRHLEAERKSHHTLANYRRAAARFVAFLEAEQLDTDLGAIQPDHVNRWIVALLDSGLKASSVTLYFQALRGFFTWCEQEEHLDRSPMHRLKGPKVAEEPVPILSPEQVAALLATCEGRGKTSFDDRRDCAILRLFLDTGLRLGELRDLRESDVDLAAEGVKVRGKGDRVRWVYPGPKTRRALSNYLLARKRHAYTEDEALWLGLQGPLGNSGLLGMLRRRARQAGIGHVHPHQLRHTWAHMMKASGGNDEDLMRLGGWRSRDILARYGSSAADQRAKEAALRLSPGERF